MLAGTDRAIAPGTLALTQPRFFLAQVRSPSPRRPRKALHPASARQKDRLGADVKLIASTELSRPLAWDQGWPPVVAASANAKRRTPAAHPALTGMRRYRC